VLVQNWPPAVAARLDLDWENVRDLNADLIDAHITSYGEIGPIFILSEGVFRKYRSSRVRLSSGFHAEQRSGVYVLLSDSLNLTSSPLSLSASGIAAM
jgi:hypothetical protein